VLPQLRGNYPVNIQDGIGCAIEQYMKDLSQGQIK